MAGLLLVLSGHGGGEEGQVWGAGATLDIRAVFRGGGRGDVAAAQRAEVEHGVVRGQVGGGDDGESAGVGTAGRQLRLEFVLHHHALQTLHGRGGGRRRGGLLLLEGRGHSDCD